MTNIKIPSNRGFNRILISTSDRIGDTLMCTPAIFLLKRSLPNLELDILVYSKIAANIFAYNPDIGQVHIATNRFTIRRLAKKYPLMLTLDSVSRLKKRLANLPTKVIANSSSMPNQHKTEQIIKFVQSILEQPNPDFDREYKLYPQETDKIKVKNLLTEQGINPEQDILIGCQLGCHRVARRAWKFWNFKRHLHKKVWPIENYVELAKKITSSAKNIRFILTGSKQEYYLSKRFLARFPLAIDLIGKTSILETAALMDLLNVYITHDTGTMHIACARKTPLVTLFRSDRISHSGPYPLHPQYAIVHNKTMDLIRVDDVYKTIIEKLR
jgi:ADP-heptose:LPS heptosyltransferase